MLLFSFTGITLNHAAQIEAKPSVQMRHGELPASLLSSLKKTAAERGDADAPLPSAVRQ